MTAFRLFLWGSLQKPCSTLTRMPGQSSTLPFATPWRLLAHPGQAFKALANVCKGLCIFTAGLFHRPVPRHTTVPSPLSRRGSRRPPMAQSLPSFHFTDAQQLRALRWLVAFHILVIASSNYLVQFPFSFTLPSGFVVHSTWGALSFPFIFLATDLTVRIFGQRLARRIIFFVMFPALLLSYVISVLFHDGAWTGWGALASFDLFVFRIALASFAAYAFGQVMDIFVFNRLRGLRAWWPAPTASMFVGNALDTVLFFSIAFYASVDPFMAENWPHIALVDYLFKLTICILMFVPAYGVLLNALTRRLTTVQDAQRP